MESELLEFLEELVDLDPSSPVDMDEIVAKAKELIHEAEQRGLDNDD